MTTDDFIASFKYSVLQHAYKNKNITDTCRIFNLSRTVYYKWLKRFNKSGYSGLINKQKSKPKMPNQIKPEYEMIIYNYIINYPTQGPARIANELALQGITISPSGIYNVLLRKGLNRRIDRLFYAQERSNNPVITERYLREIEKKRKLIPRLSIPDTSSVRILSMWAPSRD